MINQECYRVRYLWGRVPYFDQLEARNYGKITVEDANLIRGRYLQGPPGPNFLGPWRVSKK